MKILSIIVTLIGLCFTITNFVPISAIPVLLVFLVPIFLYRKSSFGYVFVSLFSMLLYFAVSALYYSPESLFDYNFYRRDGNVFITFPALLTLLLFEYKLNINKLFDSFIFFVTFINIILLVISVHHGEYYRLFLAHNAAGGFLMMIASFSLGKLLSKVTLLNIFVLIINFLSLLATDSRGSLLGFFSAAIMLFCYIKGNEKKAVLLFCLAQLFLYAWLYNNAPYNFLDMEFDHYDSELLDVYGIFERAWTFVTRGFYIWPRAIYLFLQSPFLGTGFGSYNDLPYHFIGIENLFVYNDSVLIYDDHHAHNTFLHVLAENGILGLCLLLSFIYSCNKYIKKITNKHIMYSLYLGLWAAIFSSVTEHRFFTPSQMLPFVFLFGLSHVSRHATDVKINKKSNKENYI